MNLKSNISTLPINVIIDGHVLIENLEHTNHDLVWLNNEIGKQNINDISEIFLATCDSNNTLSIYTKKEIQNSRDFFQ